MIHKVKIFCPDGNLMYFLSVPTSNTFPLWHTPFIYLSVLTATDRVTLLLYSSLHFCFSDSQLSCTQDTSWAIRRQASAWHAPSADLNWETTEPLREKASNMWPRNASHLCGILPLTRAQLRSNRSYSSHRMDLCVRISPRCPGATAPNTVTCVQPAHHTPAFIRLYHTPRNRASEIGECICLLCLLYQFSKTFLAWHNRV